MAILLIIGYIDFKWSQLYTALTGNTLGCTLLLRSHHLQFQLTKLHIGSYTKEATGTLDERRVARERHITSLNELDNLIFLTIILQLHILRIIIQRGIRIIVQVHIHLIAHLTIDIEIYLLIEVHHRGFSVADRQRWIIDALLVHTQFQFGRTLCPDTDTTRSENLLSRSQVEMHIREIELLLTLGLINFIILLTEESTSFIHLSPGVIFFRSKHDRSREPGIAHTISDNETVERIVIDHLILHVVRALQVERTLIEVAEGIRLGKLNLPTGIQQRIRNGIILHLEGLGRNRNFAALSFILCPILCLLIQLFLLSINRILSSFTGTVILQIRHDKSIAEGRNHQPEQQQIYFSLPHLQMLNSFS